MKNRELKNLGIPAGDALKAAQKGLKVAAGAGWGRAELREQLRSIVSAPESHLDDPYFGELAQCLDQHAKDQASFVPREAPAPYKQWGEDLDENSIVQMQNACQLPVSVRGALMPDAHLGYGLPIGGVLATRNAVIPYAVGVDIACRVKMTILDLPVNMLDRGESKLIRALEDETRFGIGAGFKRPRNHEVMDDDWSVTSVTAHVKSKAWKQLGSSGSGNHFVEFGEVTLSEPELGLEAGSYLALLSHSGSRGAGASVASHYSNLAMSLHPELPKQLRHLAWLDLDSQEGNEYWEAMELMGRYAAANHACIHRHVAKHLGAHVLVDIENHHNFAWKEEHDGEPLIVHRKGATPAGEGVLGIIPGSMATSTYVVRGKGSADSLESASHGAGRVMSRKKAKETFRWKEVSPQLKEKRVKLLSAGLDEVPGVYKDIDWVMDAQADLVDRVARFQPRLVKMAPAGEPAED